MVDVFRCLRVRLWGIVLKHVSPKCKVIVSQIPGGADNVWKWQRGIGTSCARQCCRRRSVRPENHFQTVQLGYIQFRGQGVGSFKVISALPAKLDASSCNGGFHTNNPWLRGKEQIV